MAMFWWGAVDFVRGPLFLALPLALCEQWVLFSCCVVTLVVTTGTTIHLAYSVLAKIAMSSAESQRWLVKHGK